MNHPDVYAWTRRSGPPHAVASGVTSTDSPESYFGFAPNVIPNPVVSSRSLSFFPGTGWLL